MSRQKRWKIEPMNPAAAELADRLKTSPLIAQALLNREISQYEDAIAFLRPSLKYLAAPELLPGLAAASKRIAQAIREGRQIVVYGDYDVDGITATSILWHAITLLGGKIRTYIPHRIDEGYGLNSEALTQIIADGAELIVTVDCGITAVEPAKIAREKNVDLIITDHHDWHGDGHGGQPHLPDCFALVHPRLGDGSYPNPHLCGAGVAFKLAWGIGQAVSGTTKVNQEFRDRLVDLTALAALGTIADVVPLVGENRIVAHYGLGGLKESRLTGIRALIASAGLSGQTLDSYDVGFRLAPRLNACGRLGHAALAVEMLTTATPSRAEEIAIYLEEQNRARQAVEKRILQQAIEQIETNRWADDGQRALVLAAEGWHAGVIGIVASRIVDRFCRPTVMIALSNGQGSGSCRSISGFHLAKALEACGDQLLTYGGHEMAAGLKIDTQNVERFRRQFCEFAGSIVTADMLLPELRLECEAELSQLTEAAVRDLQRLGPFGRGNPRPLFCLRNLTIAATPRRVGKTGDHLQFTVKQGNNSMRCIGFQFGDWFDRLSTGTVVHLAVEPGINEFGGRTNVELEIKDLQLA